MLDPAREEITLPVWYICKPSAMTTAVASKLSGLTISIISFHPTIYTQV